MFAARCCRHMSNTIRAHSRNPILSLYHRPYLVQPIAARIRVANFVHVSTMQQEDPLQDYVTRVLHQHPNAKERGKKTFNIDVLLAGDDDAADVCWTFQIAEGDDVLDTLLAYAQTFGKRGSGDADYDEYVRAFQGYINGLAVRRMRDKKV